MEMTRRQRELLEFLTGYAEEHGTAPTYEEIARRFGWRSLSTAYEHVRRLTAMGLVRRERGKPRSIEVLREPESDRERPREAVFPPEAWLRERADERPRCPLPLAVDPSLQVVRRYRERWLELRRRAAVGEEIWTFASPEAHWREGYGRAGYALVREGRVVYGVAVHDALAEPRNEDPSDGGDDERETSRTA